MKKIVALFVLLTLLSGCNEKNSHPTQIATVTNTPAAITKASPVNEKKAAIPTVQLKQGNKDAETFINLDDIKYITMEGGLHIHTKALFPEQDDEIISKIIAMINAGTGKVKSTDAEKGIVNSMARPIGILFGLKDGRKIYAWTAYKSKSFKGGWTATTLDDRFILDIRQGDNDECYTIFSRDVAKYLKEGWNTDMPRVNEVEVKSGSDPVRGKVVLRSGDMAVVTGDGCISKEVIIRIERNGKPDEAYNVGSATPQYGKWEWKQVISTQIETIDGRTVTLPKGLYDIIVDVEGSKTGVSGVIDLR